MARTEEVPRAILERYLGVADGVKRDVTFPTESAAWEAAQAFTGQPRKASPNQRGMIAAIRAIMVDLQAGKDEVDRWLTWEKMPETGYKHFEILALTALLKAGIMVAEARRRLGMLRAWWELWEHGGRTAAPGCRQKEDGAVDYAHLTVLRDPSRPLPLKVGGRNLLPLTSLRALHKHLGRAVEPVPGIRPSFPAVHLAYEDGSVAGFALSLAHCPDGPRPAVINGRFLGPPPFRGPAGRNEASNLSAPHDGSEPMIVRVDGERAIVRWRLQYVRGLPENQGLVEGVHHFPLYGLRAATLIDVRGARRWEPTSVGGSPPAAPPAPSEPAPQPEPDTPAPRERRRRIQDRLDRRER